MEDEQDDVARHIALARVDPTHDILCHDLVLVAIYLIDKASPPASRDAHEILGLVTLVCVCIPQQLVLLADTVGEVPLDVTQWIGSLASDDVGLVKINFCGRAPGAM